MKVLIDSSVWIDYFRTGSKSQKLDAFIDENLLCTNDLILAELIPFLKVAKQSKLINLLNSIEKIPLIIRWQEVIKMQTLCLENGINKFGIPDLIIVDNIIQNDVILYSFDKHFKLINNYISFNLISN